MMNNIIKSVTILLIILIFSCNNSDEEVERQQLNCLSIGLQNGVVAFYPFINGSLNDESGNNNNLTNSTSASATSDRDGNPNCAFSFNSTNNEFLEYTNPTFLDDLPVNNFSISLWYKADYDTGTAQFIHRDEGNYGCGYIGQWSIHFVDEFFVFGANGVSGYGQDIAFTSWEHIVFTVVGTNLRFYKNGILESEQNNYTCPSGNTTINQGDLFIGKFFDGRIDDIIIYNRELSTSEITELSNLSPCCI